VEGDVKKGGTWGVKGMKNGGGVTKQAGLAVANKKKVRTSESLTAKNRGKQDVKEKGGNKRGGKF